MGTKIAMGGNYGSMAKQFASAVKPSLQKAVAAGLTDTAFIARVAVQDEMRAVFNAPIKYTLSSVTVKKANPGLPISQQEASVYIRDYNGRQNSPRKYLLAEELGGTRHNKGSENVLLRAGMLQFGQQTTPAGAPISGPQMVLMLSRVKASGEQGFLSNATARTTKRLRAKKAIASKKTGTDYFIARSKLTETGMGIFKLVSPGHVKAVLWFDTKRPRYEPRFHFSQVVMDTANKWITRQIERAIRNLT